MGTTQHQEILFGRQGQSFSFEPEGRPSMSPPPRMRLLEFGIVTPSTIGECSIDPVSTRMHGDTLAGAMSLRVENIEGFVAGGRYLVTRPDREHEWIHVVGVSVEDRRLALRYPMVHRYAGAATIEGCRVSIAIDPAWSSDLENLSDTPERRHGLARYAVHWSYSIDGSERSAITYADLVSHLSHDIVTPALVDSRFPGFIAGLPPEHRVNLGADFIAEAFRAVRIEAANNVEHRRLREIAVLRELVLLRTHALRIELDVMHGRRSSDDLAYADRRYRAAYSRLVEIPRLAAPTPAAAPTPILPPRVVRKIAAGSAPRKIPKLTRY